jgi:hypothetical protein
MNVRTSKIANHTLVVGEAVLQIRVSSTDETSEQSVTYLLSPYRWWAVSGAPTPYLA